jgi:outer membrane protein assembly factor BamB
LQGQGKTQWFINSAPALAPDSILVVAGRDENLYGFHLDGKQAWKLFIPGQMLASPVIAANGDIFVGVSLVRSGQRDKGKLVCVDGDTHRVRWEYETKGAVESTPVIGDDQIVYFGDNAGWIHALRGDGQSMWRQQVRWPVRSAGNIAGANRLVFGLDNGMMAGFLCSSGGVSKKGWSKYMAR